MKKIIPNALTLSRGLLTLVIVLLFFVEIPWKYAIIFLLFVITTATDFFDGYLARRWKTISEFGIVFDSLFDKILTLTMFLLLAPLEIIPLWLLAALTLRDLFVDGVKNFSLSKGIPIPAIRSGKWKFVFQVIMLSAALLALAFPANTVFKPLALQAGLVALLFSYYSGFIYTKSFFAKIHD